MQNGVFKLDIASFVDAFLVAVIAAVLGALVTLVSAPGFDVFSTDWTLVGHNMTNLAVIAGIMSLGKDLLSTNDGRLLGIGPK